MLRNFSRNETLIDLTKIPIIRDPKFTNRINLFGETGVIMRYPNLNTFKKAEGKLDDVNAIMAVVIDCIDVIYNDDELFYASEQTKEELESVLHDKYPNKKFACSESMLKEVGFL